MAILGSTEGMPILDRRIDQLVSFCEEMLTNRFDLPVEMGKD